MKNKRNAILIAVIALCSVVYAVCGFLAPYAVGRTIDTITQQASIVGAILILAALYIGGSTSNFVLLYLSNRLAKLSMTRLRNQAMNKVERMTLATIDSRSQGSLISRLTHDIEVIGEGIYQALTLVISGTVLIIGCFVMMIALDPRIAIMIVIVVPSAVLVSSFISRKSARVYGLSQKQTAEYNGFINQAIANQPLLKAFCAQGEFFTQQEKQAYELSLVNQKAMILAASVNPSTRVINNAAYILVGLIGGLTAVALGIDAMTAGTLSGLLSYSLQFAKPINELTSILPQVQAARVAHSELKEFLASPERPDESKLPDLVVKKGEIAFENMSFSYDKKTPLLTDININIPAGSMVAIAGRTGAGKSTLTNLLLRFYQPDSGKILIDGVDIAGCNRRSVRKNIAVVLQDIWLMNASIAENIAMGQKIDKEKIIFASKSAKAHEFIMRLPQKYDTIIKQGTSLSEGEKQLLTIARAILKDAPILILDEATSSVDTRTERLISQALNEFMRGKTSFVIAHRLSTIEKADLIIVMDNGKIVESGTHKDLIMKKGYYHTLYAGQYEYNKNEEAYEENPYK